MSALAMILAAGMVMGGGPEKHSGEIAESQRLDLRGEWEGTFLDGPDSGNARLADGYLELWDESGAIELAQIQFIDEGRGKLRLTKGGDPVPLPGSYKQENDRIIICFREDPKEDQQVILILRRVKLAK
jgi:hypothetical protein